MLEIIAAVVIAAASSALNLWWAKKSGARRWCDIVASVALLLFLATVSGAVARTMLHRTVFATEVHAVFLSPVFMASAVYLTIYAAAASFAYAAGAGGRAGAR